MVASVAPPSVLSGGAVVFVLGAARILKAGHRTSCERSPRRRVSPSTTEAPALVGAAVGLASDGLFVVGQSVMFGGLEFLPELSGRSTILSFGSVARLCCDGRRDWREDQGQKNEPAPCFVFVKVLLLRAIPRSSLSRCQSGR